VGGPPPQGGNGPKRDFSRASKSRACSRLSSAPPEGAGCLARPALGGIPTAPLGRPAGGRRGRGLDHGWLPRGAPVRRSGGCSDRGFRCGRLCGRAARRWPWRFAQTSLMPGAGASPSASPEAPAKQPTRETSSPGQGAGGPATSLASGLAVPRGGYVFGRSGRFQIAPGLRTVRMFHARVKCAPNVVIPAMSLRGGSRFAYRGRIRAGKKRAVQLEVAGRFLDSSRVRGFVRARSAGCDSGKVRFLARLS